MDLQFEVLDNKRREVFDRLEVFKKYGFLAGGTALALQVGHRVSYDFDFFCYRPVKNNLILRAKKSFQIKDILINNEDEFTFLDKDGIKISFIHYPFNLKKFLLEDNFSVKILSAQGIALAKAYTLNRRNSWRDYLDLYYILQNKIITLGEIIIKAKKVYGEMFSEKLFLAQLVYTDDILKSEIDGIKILDKKIAPNEVKAFFQKEINEYLKLI